MKDELSEEEIKAALKALDQALEKGPWERSNFLRVMGKNLQKIRADLANQASGQSALAAMKASSASTKALSSGECEVYVALYSSEGGQLANWERILLNLPRQLISRPIYADEESVRQALRAKEHRVNEAYVAVVIRRDDILSLGAEKVAVDKFGKALLSIKDRALTLENIRRFIHLDKSYQYVKGHLIPYS